ncbi:MAG: hypothetical protein F4037_12545 [Gemmatimonadales bacterium]|nr:hypothetical protein [Gemmatimonadales bacterium]MYK02765.1 hypothetical protein [Candidatus Palauibacter ramosifaciens]
MLAGIALLLATPFIVTPGTIFPFTLGKALWSRWLIEAVFALWALLALRRAEFRPPRSWLLVALGAGVAVSLLAALFGASVQKSVWSSYERMGGVLDAAHWTALAVVLVSMLRTGRAWRALLGLNAAAAAAMVLLVAARRHGFELPFYGGMPEAHLPRMGGTFGNPTFLAVYLLPNLMVALGLALRAGMPAPGAPDAARREAPRTRPHWTRGVPWAAAAALHFWGLSLAGSVGGLAGLAAGTGFAAGAYAVLGAGRARRAALAVLALLAVLGAGAGVRFFHPDRARAGRVEDPVARYVATTHLQRPGVQSRLAAWETGIEGFARRPVLGWGPENFVVVFGRFASGYGAWAEPHDQAHGKLIEVAATTGAAGLAAYLALWWIAFAALWRAARRTPGPDRALAVLAGAALAGVLVQSQFLFDTPTGSLQVTVLLCFAAGPEAAAGGRRRGPRLPGALASRWAALPGRRAARIALAAAALAAAAGGAAAHGAMRRAADLDHVPFEPWSWRDNMGRGIDAFPPMANTWRWWLFNELALHWPRIRAEDGPRALALLEWVGREGERAARAEPGEWRFRASLARLYRAAAATDAAFGDAAARHAERARELAPARAVFPGPLLPPDSLVSRRLDDGRLELGWRWPEDAGYVALSQSRADGRRRFVLHAYDPARTTWVAPAAGAGGPARYRIKACRYPGQCTADVEWPAAAPDAAR